jgi:hypothetical protein
MPLGYMSLKFQGVMLSMTRYKKKSFILCLQVSFGFGMLFFC